MPVSKVVNLLQDFQVNVLAGDSSQVISIVQHISTLPSSERYKIKLNKIIYTSESLTAAQRKHVYTILGCVKICSMAGSSEAGPFGVSNPDLTEVGPAADCADFIFDTRMNIFEILPLSCTQMSGLAPLSEGEKGMIAQTSLARLRNPLVRYMTGDIGSLHPLSAKAHAHIPKDEWPYMRVLRLYGRDRRFSFDWDGAYFDFGVLGEVMQQDDLGILQWQVILDRTESSPESLLEIRLLCCQDPVYREAAIDQLRYFFDVTGGNEHRFRVVFVEGLDGFELSETGRKVVKFVNRFD
jgi:phenylacetate-coenzyme A ligase PaaK-like adenylate-forming protein